ncbi:hypothetical protein CK203_102701 [Vitis vinifera]|uniref:Uncharacterized protein n=1 Tax=Vitis vinifera TaxID=29760 RepID=A0A438FFH2_VITVI|nr:hypothetical protein CK203_102701 [Vitis vinifera]
MEMCGSKCNQGTSSKGERADPVQKFDKDPANCQVLVAITRHRVFI